MINTLLNRYFKLEKQKKLDFEKVAKILNVNFSKEFRNISDQASFDYLRPFEWRSFDQDGKGSVIAETLRAREDGFPKDTLLLADDGTSVVLMKCFGDHEEIYWVSMEDAYRYCDGDPFIYSPIIFPTFADFFSYLLDEEEKMRAEEGQE